MTHLSIVLFLTSIPVHTPDERVEGVHDLRYRVDADVKHLGDKRSVRDNNVLVGDRSPTRTLLTRNRQQGGSKVRTNGPPPRALSTCSQNRILYPRSQRG
jgi:hypothetical protein